MSQKKPTHKEKVLKGISKKVSGNQGQAIGLREQYDVIREDLIKLRDDLQKGITMAKGAVDKKKLIGQLLKSR